LIFYDKNEQEQCKVFKGHQAFAINSHQRRLRLRI